MTALTQGIDDIKLILTTDKRFRSAGIFVVCVITIWLVTATWREKEEHIVDEYVKVKVEDDKINALIQTFNKDMKEGEEEREYLKDYLGRITTELRVDKKDIDWQVNVLVNKLDDITERVDGLANKVGASGIHNAKFKEKMDKIKKKGKRGKVPVDRSML
jgi:uncharacterized coiled-coil DUF342 family protein